MTYNLYFESNQQAHVVKLQESENASEQLLTINTNAHDEILTLDKQITLISSTNIGEDKIVYVSDVSLDSNLVNVVLADLKPNKTSDESNDIVKIEGQSKKIVIRNIVEGESSYTKIEVRFTYHNYATKVIIHCVPSCNFYDVVLDFGSEASQMLIKKQGEGGGVRPQHLFANILEHYWSSKVNGQRRLYDQQDDDQELFRSIFFKKENAQMYDDFEISQPDRHDEFLDFITKRTKQSGERIPNVKISFLTGRQLDGVDRTRLHVGIIMKFLHEAVRQIADLQQQAHQAKELTAIRFTLLLPNVMPQSTVSTLLSKLRSLANDKRFLDNYTDHLNIPFIHIASCSESDASFLQRMNSVGLHSGDTCLTIDVGKGTTDFSITKFINGHKAISLFRSGFVGAGNALSYAIFANYIEAMAGNQKYAVIEKVLKAEPALLYDLDNMIEEIKHNWSSDTSSATNIPSIDKNSTVEAILDRIRGNKKIVDKNDVIRRMAEAIAENIISRLPDVRINKIIISGRAFRFNLLRSVLEAKLQEKFRGVKCEYDDKSAKCGCLFGASSNIRLSLSSSMVGVPFILDASKFVPSDPQNFVKEVTETIDTDTSIAINNSKTKNKADFWSKAKTVLSVLSEYLGNDDSEYSNGGNAVAIKMDETKELMSKGKSYPQINSNSLISISGRLYGTSDQFIIDDNISNEDRKSFMIYFDGDDFWLRHKYGMHKLVPKAIQGEQNLCFESLFPYSMSVNLDDCAIPKF